MRTALSVFTSLIIVIGIMLGTSSIVNAQGNIIPTACNTATYTLNPGTTIHFYDDGGPGGNCNTDGAPGNFANAGCETVTTICPAPGEILNIQFIVLSMFATNSGFDWMVIYEGSGTGGNILFDNRSGGPNNPYGTSCDFDNTTKFCAVDECFTFRFYASSVVNREGWDAIVSSTPTSAIVDVNVTAPTCLADGYAEILNYDSGATYTFTPAGPSIGASGEINGAVFGQSYSVQKGTGGCAATATFQVEEQLSAPDAPDIDVTAPTCLTDGSAKILNYNAGATYTFTPVGPSIGPSGEINGAVFGQSYTVEVDDGGCPATATATFQVELQLSAPDLPDVNVAAPTCLADGSAEILNYDNGATYSFTPAGPSIGTSGEINGATFGQSYSVEIDNGGCTATATFQVEEQLSAPDAPDIDVTAPTCLTDGSAKILNYDAGATYTFTPVGPSIGPSGEINGAVFGQSYTVEVDDGGCPATANTTFQVELQLSAPDVPDIDVTAPTCLADGYAEILNYDAGATYTFTPAGLSIAASGEINGASFGQSYSVEIDNGGCTATATFQVEGKLGAPDAPDIDITTPTCLADGSANILNYNAGATYTYTPAGPSTGPSGEITGGNFGQNYSVEINNGGCTATATFQIKKQLDTPTINNISSTDATCNTDDGTITVLASGGPTPFNYVLGNGQTSSNGTFTDLAGGNYTVTVMNGDGCETNQPIVVGKADGPTLTIVNSENVSCFGENDGGAEVNATGGVTPYTYDWSPVGGNTATANGLAAGTYTVMVKDGSGCSDQVQITISAPTEITIDKTITNSDCGLDNGEIALNVTGGTGNYTYVWNPNVSTSDQATDLAVGNYEVIVTDDSGCDKTVSYNVILGNSFYIEAIPDSSTILQGASVDIHLFVDPNVTVETIIWTPTAGLSCSDCKNPVATPEFSTTYIVTATDDNGCTATDTINIYVILPCPDVFVPNTFSPNKDGLNDLQCVIGECIVTLNFTIFNRWGEIIFQSIDQKECWDGTFRGKPVQSGVYVYKLTATLEDGSKVDLTGNVTVVR